MLLLATWLVWSDCGRDGGNSLGGGRAGACVKKVISMSSALTSTLTSKHTSDVGSWSTDVVEPEKTSGKSPFFDLTRLCTVC